MNRMTTEEKAESGVADGGATLSGGIRLKNAHWGLTAPGREIISNPFAAGQ